MKGISRYASNLPVVRETDERKPKFSETCEVPGCQSLYLGDDSQGVARYACGKTCVLVDDFRGDKRGICAEHYAQGIIAAGLAVNQSLIGRDKRLDPTLIHEHWAALESAEKAKGSRVAEPQP